MIQVILFVIGFIVFLPWISKIFFGCDETDRELNKLLSEFQDFTDRP